MAYESYKLLQSSTTSFKDKMLEDKKKQIQFLYKHAIDKEDSCVINGKPFIESPRLFDRKIKTSYFQTLTCETVNELDRFNSGNLLEFDRDNWICTSSFVFHGLYCKGDFIRCNYILRWQSEDGTIIERPCLVQSAAQYNSGEKGNQTITLGSDQVMIVLPNDKDTILLDTSLSFFIDRNTVHPTAYKVTRNDTVPYSDWDEGCINIIATERTTSDKDRPDLMLCDYHSPTSTPTPPESNETTDLSVFISGSSELKVGFSKTYQAIFCDKDGKEITNHDFKWNIVSNFEVTKVLDEQKILLQVDDKSKIGDEFLLQVLKEDVVVSEMKIRIVDLT